MSESTPPQRASSKRRRNSDADAAQSKVRWIASLVSAPAILSILWPAILLAVGYAAWQQWGSQYVAHKYYGVQASAINVTSPPTYVRSDIITTVYRDAAMDKLSLMDEQACAKVASAFASNAWVRRVVGVRKIAGGRLHVRLEYRQPVAMVHVISRHPEHDGAGFFAIDGEGVLLPPSDFSRSETEGYLHIIVPGAYPTGGVGAEFGDSRVQAAALLAYLLHPYREKLGLTSIGVHGDLRQNPVVQLEIAGSEDRRWFWGSPPSEEAQGEPTAKMKLQSLIDGAPSGSDLRQVQYTPTPIVQSQRVIESPRVSAADDGARGR
ncbi:cell division protein FtsQ/DivIB [Allorhodopirellula solitaria]|uniref:Cell division protein FtsQ n=1 Tax=Allorhodopirellula solitaria TaxID=2527987 RepID=A0A5C5YKP4_9BACT|nr:hypothetical protein [Allorhodopirellula solitaria]TWT75421.1 Cell division protein FtsQ [Allorhodopirellula solitaria]